MVIQLFLTILCAPSVIRRRGNVYKTLNNMFPLELTVIHKHNLNMECEMNTKLWHQRFGYLNAKSLKLLKNIDMVHGMPIIQQCKCVEIVLLGNRQ